MSPVCSAISTVVAVGTGPRVGWVQRSWASTPVTVPSTVATTGWYTTPSSPRAWA